MQLWKIALLLCLGALSLQADEESDRAELRAMKDLFEHAVNANDLARLPPILSNDMSGVVVTGESVHGIEEIRACWEKARHWMRGGGTYQVQVTTEKEELFGDVAVCYGKAEESLRIPTGQEFRFPSSWTVLCKREGGVWKVARLQATMDPINNPFVGAKVTGVSVQYGMAGLVCGVVAGWLLGRGFRRKAKTQ